MTVLCCPVGPVLPVGPVDPVGPVLPVGPVPPCKLGKLSTGKYVYVYT